MYVSGFSKSKKLKYDKDVTWILYEYDIFNCDAF